MNEYDNRPPSRLVLTEADLHPVFIVVQVLEKGQYFVSYLSGNKKHFPVKKHTTLSTSLGLHKG